SRSLSLSGAFSSLKQLSVLDLSHNLLTELSDKALSGIQQLRQLDLSANFIANLSVHTFPGSLRILHLNHNRLKSVPVATCNLVMLSSLHLSSNPIRELTALSFGRKLGSLRQLFLENLPLENLTSSAFKRLCRLEVLSLRNSSLVSLLSLKTLSTLYLTGNKWSCDCSLIWLRTWQKKASRKDRSSVECSSPVALQGQQLVNIELQKLTRPPFQTVVDTISHSSANVQKATTPFTKEPLPKAATTPPTTALITSMVTTTTGPASYHSAIAGPTRPDKPYILEKYDPCLSDHINSSSTRTKGNTALVVTGLSMEITTSLKCRVQPIRFQWYYNEAASSSQNQGVAQSKLTSESSCENSESDQHVYMTVASQWPEEEFNFSSPNLPSAIWSKPAGHVCFEYLTYLELA
ncbi:nyctalopin-like, partial [Varanus komodoensis]|uniref:nyctalopin-like n=1 Tax=Varanus komodoensis TaxID=61221 RepID=UPI001CF7E5DF